ncbi:restriction endonuclease [Pseudomonas sp. MAP12]|uniref:Restriction endonuclease n=1 Tax=Geopseudomonas aromaticivorans TaxID=2849492 RepID=A0ABS6MWT1_9GAMM|nr:type II restriction endonuclease [Pseudomonas aromaticivorans]MBV2133265.1 restriction endonuclease [Pseudomonas aromaticivorans]
MESLRKHFTGVAAKYLTVVDATPKSHQHEIGSNAFTKILGNPGSQKVYLDGTFLYVDDELDEPLNAAGTLTWYDTRLNQPHRSAEYRLYYRENPVTERMTAGDFCVIARKPDDSLLVVITPPNSTSEQQIRWLFGIDRIPEKGFEVRAVGQQLVHMAEASILEELGIEVRRYDENWLDRILARFSNRFPTTTDFSDFARETCPVGVAPAADPDTALMAWIEHEEMLFRTLERQIVQTQLDAGFRDVDHFVEFSLSVQNRRKSRIGYALEHHLAKVFEANSLPFERQAVTENRSKADFLFPSAAKYHDKTYPDDKLIMLASKSSCKDRWRQALAEAARIKRKHLLTLEPAISSHQTDEMAAHNLQLVVPRDVMRTYSSAQQGWLLDLTSYVSFVRSTMD